MIVSSVLLENYGYAIADYLASEGKFAILSLNLGDSIIECYCRKHNLEIPDKSKFYACWQGAPTPRRRRGRYLLESGSVEPISRWLRQTSYKPAFGHQASFGKEAEGFLICGLMQSGILVHRATPFEDEVLGVDMWLRMKAYTIDNTLIEASEKKHWLWLPVNLTLKPEGQVSDEPYSKYQHHKRRGVLPVRATNAAVKDRVRLIQQVKETMAEAVSDFHKTKTPILARRRAKEMEVNYAPETASFVYPNKVLATTVLV